MTHLIRRRPLAAGIAGLLLAATACTSQPASETTTTSPTPHACRLDPRRCPYGHHLRQDQGRR
ncbi:MAG: hypothetical protein WKG07_38025 [Hymenobacter sp.]